jgi:glycine C-acetyltransferase
MERLNAALVADVESLRAEGRAKAPERVITGYIAPAGGRGPRYRLEGRDQEYIRMNSNSYLSLSHEPRMLHVADEAAVEFGVGPGAVRFIDGTFRHHVSLERRVAKFMGKPAAKIFNSAYTSNLGLALAVQNKQTFWIGDALNHNCIIRAMRISGVPSDHKAIYKHNDINDLGRCLESIPDGIERVIVIFDGIFSMRGDVAPLAEINKAVEPYRDRFKDGLITVVDDSHGIGAFGSTGRGTIDHADAPADVIVGTFGKAFGVNGGFVAGSPELIEAIRQKSDTYIYTNPLSVADCAAAEVALDITDSAEGLKRLKHLHARIAQFRSGIAALGLESIDGPHPVVPLLVRDTAKCQKMVRDFFEHGVLVVGLAFPVVPKGDDTIRFQINAAHTEQDIDEVLQILDQISQESG